MIEIKNYFVDTSRVNDIGEKIQGDLLGMVELYDANCILYNELMGIVKEYERLYKLKRKYRYNIQEDMVYYSGYNQVGERVYYLPIHHPSEQGGGGYIYE